MTMFALASFMCAMITHSLKDVYTDTEPAAAVAFENGVKKEADASIDQVSCVGTLGPVLGVDFWNKPLGEGIRTLEDCRAYATIPATVRSKGYDYTGTCEGINRDDGGSGDLICDAGDVANSLCRDTLRAEFPRIARRRLEEEEEEEPLEGRELRGGHGGHGGPGCLNVYVPWIVVEFSDPTTDTPLRRCSYYMGTKGNSESRDWATVQATPAIGSSIGVWDVRGHADTRCVLGWANRTTLNSFALESGKSNAGMKPLIALFAFITICTFLLCIRSALSGDEHEEKDDKKKDDEEEVSDE